MQDMKETPPLGEGSLHFLGACPLHARHRADAAGETAGLKLQEGSQCSNHGKDLTNI